MISRKTKTLIKREARTEVPTHRKDIENHATSLEVLGCIKSNFDSLSKLYPEELYQNY